MTESSKPREPLVGFMVIEDYTEDYSDWSGQIAFPDPEGANLYWQNTIPMIEKRAHDEALSRIAELEFQLADRSEKYKIAMDKGVDVLSYRIKLLEEECVKYEEALQYFIQALASAREKIGGGDGI